MRTFRLERLHILLNTFGSLGDLHPYIAVGLGLRQRGHIVTIATSEIYRAKVEGEGLQFHPVRPDIAMLLTSPEMMRQAFHPRTGGEYIMRKIFLPEVAGAYEDLLPAAREADLLVGHPLAFALPTVAELLGKSWVSVILQPALLFSVYDPPSISGVPWLKYFRSFGPRFWRVFWRIIRAVVRRWAEPINALRDNLNLPRMRNPALDDMFSPFANQAWFSRALASPQPDWPAGLEVTGFPVYDKLEPGQGLSPDLAKFLDSGPPPVVFTLGSSAVFNAGNFYEESVKAAMQLGVRAVLLVGLDAANIPSGLTPDIFVAQYAPYSELFGRASAIVHQGGAGTTAAALHAATPAIFVPFSHDQPDNARRVTALGCARTIPRHKYKANRVAGELKLLLGNSAVRASAHRVAAVLAGEDGVEAACDGLESAARNFRDASNRNPAR